MNCLSCKLCQVFTKKNPYKSAHLCVGCGKTIANIPENEEIQNNHLVSRFHTKSWERKDRKLSYYSFKYSKVKQKSSESLFALRGINSKEVEDWFNLTFEDINGKWFSEFNRTTLLTQNQIKSFLIMFLSQNARLFIKQGIKEYNQKVDNLKSLSDGQWNQILSYFDRNFEMIPYETDQDYCFPESCIFPAIYDNSKKGAMIFPLHSKAFIVFLPKGDIEKFNQTLSEDNFLIRRWSVGLNGIEKVVLPNNILDQFNNRRSEIEICTAYRNLNEMDFTLFKLNNGTFLDLSIIAAALR